MVGVRNLQHFDSLHCNIDSIARDKSVHNLVSDQLKAFKRSSFLKVLGETRIQQYKRNYGLKLAFKYFNGEFTTKEEIAGAMSNLIGCEFNTYLIQDLKDKGLVNIAAEVYYNGASRADAVGEAVGRHLFTQVFPNGYKKLHYLSKGKNYFEVKAKNKLRGDAVRQVYRMRDAGLKNVNLYLLKDTDIRPRIAERIYDAGGVILQADIDKEGIIERISNLSLSYKKIMNKKMYLVTDKRIK